jgi:hypothetical protein
VVERRTPAIVETAADHEDSASSMEVVEEAVVVCEILLYDIEVAELEVELCSVDLLIEGDVHLQI